MVNIFCVHKHEKNRPENIHLPSFWRFRKLRRRAQTYTIFKKSPSTKVNLLIVPVCRRKHFSGKSIFLTLRDGFCGLENPRTPMNSSRVERSCFLQRTMADGVIWYLLFLLIGIDSHCVIPPPPTKGSEERVGRSHKQFVILALNPEKWSGL